MWTEKYQSAFEKIKKALTSDSSPTHFDPKLNIVVTSDTNDLGIGAVILHKYDDRSTKPIMYTLRSFIAAEKNYCLIEKEALVIIFTMKNFHKFLHRWEFLKKKIKKNDHQPLSSIYSLKKVVPTYTANRLQHWGTILLNYNYKWNHYHWRN